MENKKILVIGGPTGVGESTITREIIKAYPIFARLVTATTRKPRLKEKNKIDYYFFSNKEFKKEISKGNILEYQNTMNGKIYYGSYRPDLEKKIKKGFNIIVNPDVVGAKYYKTNYNATTIFIAPGSLSDLKKRHLSRNPLVQKEELEKRLDYARYEIKNEAKFYDYIVKNRQRKIQEAIKEIKKIIKKEGYKLK